MNDASNTHDKLPHITLSSAGEALAYINTRIRSLHEADRPDLGEAKIFSSAEVGGHQVWDYHIEGLPVSRDGRRHWLLDTGDSFDTTLRDDENTLEKAFAKYLARQQA